MIPSPEGFLMPENHDPVVIEDATPESGGCPVAHGGLTQPTMGDANRDWWPNRLNLKILAKNPAVANPMGEEFNYAEEFQTLDLAAVKADLAELLTTLIRGMVFAVLGAANRLVVVVVNDGLFYRTLAKAAHAVTGSAKAVAAVAKAVQD